MATWHWHLVTDVITWGKGAGEKLIFPQGLNWSCRTRDWECVCERTHAPPLREEDALRPLLEPHGPRSWGINSLQGNLSRSAKQGQGPVCGGGQGHLRCDTQVLLGQRPRRCSEHSMNRPHGPRAAPVIHGAPALRRGKFGSESLPLALDTWGKKRASAIDYLRRSAEAPHP